MQEINDKLPFHARAVYNERMKKKMLIVGAVFVMAVPLIALAAGLVPCGTSTTAACTLCDLFKLGNKVTNFLTLTIAPALAVLAFALAGFKILTSGGSPGARQEGIKIIRNTIIGLLIVFGAWIIINELLLFFAGTLFTTSEGIMPWDKITCIAPVEKAKVTVAKFADKKSIELIALIAYVKNAVPTMSYVEPTTDLHIASGTCDPTSSNKNDFSNSSKCQHAQYSCHYGGKSCVSRGSFAFDFTASSASDPTYIAVNDAAKAYAPGAFVQFESSPAHGHASIGWTNGCGCDQI